jgi:hypothetical protein
MVACDRFFSWAAGDAQCDPALSGMGAGRAAPTLAPVLLGLPCLAVPASMRADIPIGVQLVAARYHEDHCFGCRRGAGNNCDPNRSSVIEWISGMRSGDKIEIRLFKTAEFRRLKNCDTSQSEQGTLVLSPSIVRANRGRLDFLTRRFPVFKRC